MLQKVLNDIHAVISLGMKVCCTFLDIFPIIKTPAVRMSINKKVLKCNYSTHDMAVLFQPIPVA